MPPFLFLKSSREVSSLRYLSEHLPLPGGSSLLSMPPLNASLFVLQWRHKVFLAASINVLPPINEHSLLSSLIPRKKDSCSSIVNPNQIGNYRRCHSPETWGRREVGLEVEGWVPVASRGHESNMQMWGNVNNSHRYSQKNRNNVKFKLITCLMIYIDGEKYELIKVEINGTWTLIQTDWAF